MPGIQENAMPLLEQAMRFRLARQAVLSGNVANADTPGFRRRDIEFQGALQNAAQRLERTHAKHLGPSGAGRDGDYRLEMPSNDALVFGEAPVLEVRNGGTVSARIAVERRD